MKNNIDKDIEILKNPHKMELTQLIRTFKREGIENFVTVRKENLENVLSELETYKKIAEKLAEEVISNHKILEYHHLEEDYKFYRSEKEEVLDWARKEVENESSN